MNSPEIVVVGAGIAGLACARALAQRGRGVTILEAQSRVGGRILTQRAHGEVIELGAEFVHGRPPALIDLIQEAGCTLYERRGQQIRFEGGRLQAGSERDRETTFDPVERLANFTGDDLSFADYLDRQAIEGEARQSALGYVEGFNAADARQVSATSLGVQQRAEDAIGGDRVSKLREGYDLLPTYLAEQVTGLGGTLRLQSPVSAVRWRRGAVELDTAQGVARARQCVITLPLGVLQARTVPFHPDLSQIARAASALRMGPVCRFTMVFRTRFWTHLEPQPEMRQMSFLFAFEQTPSVWWTSHPEPAHTLTGWVGGPRSAPLLAKSKAERARAASDTLAGIFSLESAWVWEQMLGFYMHDWSADPWSMGSYSYVAVGGLELSRELSEPVEDTLFFAGEHTDLTGNWGTVHAALGSGLRAAAQILGEPQP